jgi:hypothetical protein
LISVINHWLPEEYQRSKNNTNGATALPAKLVALPARVDSDAPARSVPVLPARFTGTAGDLELLDLL